MGRRRVHIAPSVKIDLDGNLLIFINFFLRIAFFMLKTMSYDALPNHLTFAEKSCKPNAMPNKFEHCRGAADFIQN